MENLIEIIGPIVFAAIYILGNFFNKNKEENESNAESQEDYNFEIKEEEYQPPLQVQKTAKPVAENRKQKQQIAPPQSADFSWENSHISYESQMEAQLKKIEATKREASKLLAQTTSNQIQHSKQTNTTQPAHNNNLLGSVRSKLNDPKVARVAFIYGEVLKPPISMREHSSF